AVRSGRGHCGASSRVCRRLGPLLPILPSRHGWSSPGWPGFAPRPQQGITMPATVLEALHAIGGTLPAIDDGTLRLSYADVQRAVASERRWLQSLGVRRCAL